MKSRLHHESGMTLMEVIIVITLVAIMSGVVVQAFAYWQRVGTMSHQIMLRQQEMQTIITRIVDGTRSVAGLLAAKQLVSPTTACTADQPCASVHYRLIDDTQVHYFAVPANASCDPTLQPVEGSKVRLCAQIGTNAPKELATDLDTFAAINESGVLRLTVSTSVRKPSGTRPISFTTTVRPRNIAMGD